jgi:hypothetical protein
MMNMSSESDEHALDESLGNIHACALALELMGLTDWALKLANAHEKIQTYLIENIES